MRQYSCCCGRFVCRQQPCNCRLQHFSHTSQPLQNSQQDCMSQQWCMKATTTAGTHRKTLPAGLLPQKRPESSTVDFNGVDERSRCCVLVTDRCNAGAIMAQSSCGSAVSIGQPNTTAPGHTIRFNTHTVHGASQLTPPEHHHHQQQTMKPASTHHPAAGRAAYTICMFKAAGLHAPAKQSSAPCACCSAVPCNKHVTMLSFCLRNTHTTPGFSKA